MLTSSSAAVADDWFNNLEQQVHVMLSRYANDDYKKQRLERQIKIAVLDTGAAKSSTCGPTATILRSPKVRSGKQLDTALPWDVDTDGHGTHAAGLIRKVCPYADIYIYRVFQGDDSMNKTYVTEALVDAIDVKKVDIVSMSFG
jgi:subtilisin family serine protease